MNTFLWKNEQQIGPYDDVQIRTGLRSGTFNHDDLACREGSHDWHPLHVFYPAPSSPSPQSHVPPFDAVKVAPQPNIFASPIVKYGGGLILLCIALCIVGLISVVVPHIKDFISRPMPITAENLRLLNDRRLAGLNEMFSVVPKGELTQRPKPAKQFDEHLQLLMIDKDAIEGMGYNYNSTLKKIAQNYAAIREYPVFGEMALQIARNAHATRQEAVHLQLITSETVNALEAMPKTE